MPSLGALLYRSQTKWKHGPRVAYFRDHIRPRILRTQAISDTHDPRCEIHVLTSASDWLNLIWALKSFYYYSGRKYGLCIHDDGTITPDIRAILSSHFPSARLIERSSADQQALEHLKDYPRCLEFRLKNHLSPKLFDFPLQSQSPRILLLDSDVLFFAEPIVLLERIENPAYHFNSVNRDVSDASNVDEQTVKELIGIQSIERFNSGLGLIFVESLRLDWIEEFLGLPNITNHSWRIEQTLYMLCSARFGCELLPSSYDVYLGSGFAHQSRHYVGAVRHLMYSEGMKRLIKNKFLSGRQS